MLELLIIDSMNIDAALVLMGLDTPNDLELNCISRLITKIFAKLLPSAGGPGDLPGSKAVRPAREARSFIQSFIQPFVPRAERDGT